MTERRNLALREAHYREMRDELQTAHDMQMELLPETPPELTGYTLDGLLVHANNIRGDYFHYRWLHDDYEKFAIIIANVSGKAMEAAVTALRFNEMLRYECRGRTSPIDIAVGLNDSLDSQIDTATFTTCRIAVVEIATNQVKLLNAGHCFPIQVCLKFGPAIPVEPTGLPLGIPAVLRQNHSYESKTLTLAPGDGLVLYSDGVIEARNPAGEMVEEARFVSLIEEDATWKSDTSGVVKTIHNAIESFIGLTPIVDDLTLVVFQRNT